MKIQVLSVSTGTKTSAAGKSYQNAEIAYKNLDNGKVESKNISQYSKVFKAVADATPTMFYDVVSVKNQAGFWDWESFQQGSAVPNAAPSGASPFNKPSPAPKSTFETPEERAKKQVYIVKQSSLSAAVEILKHNNPKGLVNPDDVITMAQGFVDWVFETEKTELFETSNDLEVE